jgi:hypothetical protein
VIAATYEPDEGPLVIADYADNPGAGGYGDSTELLRALLKAGVTNACFGPMVDRGAAQALHAADVGERVQIALGGKTDPRFGGGPLAVEGEARFYQRRAFHRRWFNDSWAQRQFSALVLFYASTVLRYWWSPGPAKYLICSNLKRLVSTRRISMSWR